MCVDHTMMCVCKKSRAGFNFRNDILPAEVIGNLYCPHCSTQITYDPGTMLRDNGWVIDFDMDVVNFMKNRMPARELTPEFIFDEGFCTWRGVYPTDHIDVAGEREELIRLSKVNPRKYLEEFRRWSIERMARLAGEGWRKANAE